MADEQIPPNKETEKHGCFEFIVTGDKSDQDLVITDAAAPKKEKHTHTHSSSSSDEEGQERKRKKNKKSLKEAVFVIGGEEEENKLKDTCVPIEKKGFLEKIKEKLPGQHKKELAEGEEAQSLDAVELSETKKGLIDKIKEKLPGHHNNKNEVHK